MTTPSAPRISDDELARPTVTECEHKLVHASVFSEGTLAGQVALWSCDFCQLRFYPACPTCVDVGHRGVTHLIAAALSAPAAGLDVERLERLRQIEAAARDAVDAAGTERWPVNCDALRAALAAEEVR